jgi:hypothetical protein
VCPAGRRRRVHPLAQGRVRAMAPARALRGPRDRRAPRRARRRVVRLAPGRSAGRILRLAEGDAAKGIRAAREVVPQAADAIQSSFARGSGLWVGRDRFYVLYQKGGPNVAAAFTLDGRAEGSCRRRPSPRWTASSRSKRAARSTSRRARRRRRRGGAPPAAAHLRRGPRWPKSRRRTSRGARSCARRRSPRTARASP